MEGLDENDVKILNTALADHDAWPNKTLSRALAERGVKIGDGAIRKHRARECSCR
jgi:repressor of nif and glnA expression